MQKEDKVLVTGANGFVASHCIKMLLEKNYKVIGTVRDLNKKEKYEQLFNLYPEKKENLEIVEADLSNENCWDDIIKNCTYVLHIACPVFAFERKNKKQLLNTIKTGTETILNSCIKNKIKKVVITSSISAMNIIKAKKTIFYTKEDFTDSNYPALYPKLKLQTEKTAWEIYKKNKDKLNLTIINPGCILGPTIINNFSESLNYIRYCFTLPFKLKLYLPIVHVNDVALAHLKCLEHVDVSKSKRYLLVENTYFYSDIINVLKDEYHRKGFLFPKFYLGMYFLKFFAYFSTELKLLWDSFSDLKYYNNEEVKKDLKIYFKHHRNTIVDCSEDLIKKGRIKKN